MLQGNEVWLVKLEGIDGPEDAEALRNHRLLIRAADRPPLEDEDEFYVQVRCLTSGSASPRVSLQQDTSVHISPYSVCNVWSVHVLPSNQCLLSSADALLQDLVGMRVVKHGSQEPVGTVIDIYDGTGITR